MLTNDSRVKPPVAFSTPERRVALEKRRRVAEMSREEIERELLTSEVTGLPNRRAFNEAGVAQAIAMCDVDGLKALNEYGYESGDAVLRATAEALCEAGLEAYHDKGDEFLCRDNDAKQLEVKLEQAKAILRDRPILVQRANGTILTVTGADYSYGVGKDLNEAELRLKRQKTCRQNSGGIARGELRGIVVKTQINRPDSLNLR